MRRQRWVARTVAVLVALAGMQQSGESDSVTIAKERHVAGVLAVAVSVSPAVGGRDTEFEIVFRAPVAIPDDPGPGVAGYEFNVRGPQGFRCRRRGEYEDAALGWYDPVRRGAKLISGARPPLVRGWCPGRYHSRVTYFRDALRPSCGPAQRLLKGCWTHERRVVGRFAFSVHRPFGSGRVRVPDVLGDSGFEASCTMAKQDLAWRFHRSRVFGPILVRPEWPCGFSGPIPHQRVTLVPSAVIAQRPAPGRVVTPESVVELFVRCGPVPTPRPYTRLLYPPGCPHRAGSSRF